MPTTETRRKDRRKRRARQDRRRAAASDPSGQPEKKKEGWRETLRFWAISIFVIVIVRMFLFEPYRIPSESMEDTLLVGDFLIVSKLHYGPRTPATLGVPLTRIYLPGLQFPQTRLPGFSEVQRGDVIVFNYPAAYDVVRTDVPESIPIERRDPYIKRVVAVPGDTVAVVDKQVYLNGRPQPLLPTMKQLWRVTANDAAVPPAAVFEELGIQYVRRVPSDSTAALRYNVLASPVGAEALGARAEVARVEPAVFQGAPTDLRLEAGDRGNPHQMLPVIVPGEGITLPLTRETWPALVETITRHEGRAAQSVGDSLFLIDGQPATSYTFTQDYYFVMGDNRDNSVDGRYWGFVPHSHLIGKAVLTFMSFERWLPPIPRFNRFLRPVR